MSAKKKKYTCAACGGPVGMRVSDMTAQTDGQKARGLGTYRCLNGCPKRRLSVTRFVGSGKENEHDRMESRSIRRPIAVRVSAA